MNMRYRLSNHILIVLFAQSLTCLLGRAADKHSYDEVGINYSGFQCKMSCISAVDLNEPKLSPCYFDEEYCKLRPNIVTGCKNCTNFSATSVYFNSSVSLCVQRCLEYARTRIGQGAAILGPKCPRYCRAPLVPCDDERLRPFCPDKNCPNLYKYVGCWPTEAICPRDEPGTYACDIDFLGPPYPTQLAPITTRGPLTTQPSQNSTTLSPTSTFRPPTVTSISSSTLFYIIGAIVLGFFVLVVFAYTLLRCARRKPLIVYSRSNSSVLSDSRDHMGNPSRLQSPRSPSAKYRRTSPNMLTNM